MATPRPRQVTVAGRLAVLGGLAVPLSLAQGRQAPVAAAPGISSALVGALLTRP